jgi:hypothetical protein
LSTGNRARISEKSNRLAGAIAESRRIRFLVSGCVELSSRRCAQGLGVAVAWSAVLFVLWAVVLRIGLALSSESYLRGLFVYHLVYGFGLGLWIRVTWIT